MAGSNGPALGLFYGMTPGETGWSTGVNASLQKLNFLLGCAVVNATTTAPPGSPTDGARYIIAATATGAWATKEGQIAAWDNGAWVYFTPIVGLVAFDISTASFRHYSGSAWTDSVVITGAVRSNLHLAPSYDDDAAAAAGGVELGEEYRNGNFKMLRLT